MGCDIHGMYERKSDYRWINSGDPDIGRNYTIFGIIGNVRNEGHAFIAEDRFELYSDSGIKGFGYDGSNYDFSSLSEHWGADGHSHSFVTLKELKEFDITQKYYSKRLVTGRDENGKITGTCAMTTADHLGEVGEIEIFGVWGDKAWRDLISYGENIRQFHDLDDDEVRLVFFFDN